MGGVLYLINVMPPLDPDIGAWALLEALARALLADDLEAHATDPLWPALAALDGRDDSSVLDIPAVRRWIAAALPPIRQRLEDLLEWPPSDPGL